MKKIIIIVLVLLIIVSLFGCDSKKHSEIAYSLSNDNEIIDDDANDSNLTEQNDDTISGDEGQKSEDKNGKTENIDLNATVPDIGSAEIDKTDDETAATEQENSDNDVSLSRHSGTFLEEKSLQVIRFCAR